MLSNKHYIIFNDPKEPAERREYFLGSDTEIVELSSKGERLISFSDVFP